MSWYICAIFIKMAEMEQSSLLQPRCDLGWKDLRFTRDSLLAKNYPSLLRVFELEQATESHGYMCCSQ